MTDLRKKIVTKFPAAFFSMRGTPDTTTAPQINFSTGPSAAQTEHPAQTTEEHRYWLQQTELLKSFVRWTGVALMGLVKS